MTHLVAGLLLMIAAASQGDTPRFQSLMSLGRSALQVKDYLAARTALEKAVALRPDDPGAHFYLAQALAGDKKYQFASRHLKETLSLSPGHVEALLDLAAIEENTGSFDQAAAHYRQALASGPNASAQRGLASLLAKQGRQDEAIAMLRSLAGADASDVESRYRLGLALMQAGDCMGAIPEFRAVTAAGGEHQGALFNLGNCLNRTGAGDEAARTLERFRNLSQAESERIDRQREAHFLLLEAVDVLAEAVDGDNLGSVIEKLDEAIRLHPENPSAHAIRAQILDVEGRASEALEAYLESSALDPSDPVVLTEIGRLLAKTGRFDEAVGYLRRAAAMDPRMPQPHFLLAAVYRRLGRPSEAAAEEALHRELAAAQGQPPR